MGMARKRPERVTGEAQHPLLLPADPRREGAGRGKEVKGWIANQRRERSKRSADLQKGDPSPLCMCIGHAREKGKRFGARPIEWEPFGRDRVEQTRELRGAEANRATCRSPKGRSTPVCVQTDTHKWRLRVWE
jgi:hypothetical protein